MTHKLNRRGFVKACGKTALAAAATRAALGPLPAMAHLLEDAPKVMLVDADGAPLRASSLKPNETLIFNYPYVPTPAMLIVLDGPTPQDQQTRDAEGHEYLWPGGVGPGRNIVAYAAICAHALSYVSHDTAFLHYSPDATSFGDKQVIVCCAHGSEYDPARGAAVVKGPAEYPLATIELAHDPEADTLTATGVIGTELFGRFYDAYRSELRDEYSRKKYRKLVTETTIALPIDQYSEDVLDC